MFLKISLAIFTFIISFFGTQVYQNSQSFDIPRNYVYQIYSLNGSSGSGVLISKNLMLTAAHVAKIPNLYVDGKKVVVLKQDEQKDLALLKVEVDCPCAPLGTSFDIGNEGVVIGYPMGKAKFATKGHLQGFIENRVYFDGPIAPGNSGGGLFMFQKGTWKLIGITVEVEGLPLGFFGLPVFHMTRVTPIEQIKEFLK